MSVKQIQVDVHILNSFRINTLSLLLQQNKNYSKYNIKI